MTTLRGTVERISTERILGRFETYTSLTPGDIAALMPLAGRPQLLSKGATLYRQGQGKPALYLVLKGWTSSSMFLPDGSRQLLKVHLPGDMIGLASLPLSVTADTVTALTDATVSEVPMAAFGDLFRTSPRMAALLFLISQEERLLLMDRLTSTGKVNAGGRFAAALLQLHLVMSRLDPTVGHDLTVPLTRIDVADLIGVTPVHLSRTLRDLQSRNIVDWQRSTISILDMPALQKMAALPKRTMAHDPDWLPKTDAS